MRECRWLLFGLLAVINAQVVISGNTQLKGKTHHGQSFDWFVDSASGNDANSGKCSASQVAGLQWSACAFRTLAALQAVMNSNQSACVTYGSYFQNQGLSIPTLQHASVAACGNPSLAKPMIDASQVITGTWILTGGGCYSISITVPVTTASTSYNAFDNGTLLTSASSAVDCQTRSHSYWMLFGSDFAGAFQGGTTTLYLNSGSNPNTDGHTYKVSSQPFGIDTWTPGVFTYPTIRNVATCCQAGSDGSTRLGGGGLSDGQDFLFGGKHNILTAASTTVSNFTAQYCNTTLSCVMVVSYDSVESGTTTLSNGTIDGTGSVGGSPNAILNHFGSGSGTLALNNITIRNGFFDGVSSDLALSVNGLSCDSTVDTCFQQGVGSTFVNVTSSAFTRDFALTGSGAYSITNSTFSGGRTTGVIYAQNTISLTATGNTYNTSSPYAYYIGSSVVVTSDNNSFFSGASTTPGNIAGSAVSQAAWIALGFDAHSVFH